MFFHVSEDLLYPNSFRFEDDFSLCFHISVGSDWSGVPDPLITSFPQKMEIAYVKVYEKNHSDVTLSQKEVEFPDLKDYSNLFWNDEFEGEGITENYWTHETGDYWYNNEIQAYTSDSTNSFIKNGKLVINAMHTPGHVPSIRDYTSARLITKDKVMFGFGRIDFRIKVESGKGIWPAAWLLPNDNKFGPWPSSGEIDVLEIFGSDSLTQHMTVHFGKDRNDHRTRGGKLHYEPGFNDQFHTYSLIREKDNMWFYFDEKPCFHVSRAHCYPHHYPFNEDFYVVLNLAIGGGTAGYPDENTLFPRKMWVDYVRIYKQ
jgi:beta-glucanase (GH16 family)